VDEAHGHSPEWRASNTAVGNAEKLHAALAKFNPILQYCDMVIVEPVDDARSGAPRRLPQYCNIAILQYLLAASILDT
jgi:hypothetical protein